MRTPLRTASACAALLLAEPALATEGGSGAYLLGSRDSLAGIVPPPGTYLSADVLHIDGDVDFLAIGGAALTDVNANLWVTKVNLTQGFKGKILGGRPAVTFTVPIVSGRLKFRGTLVDRDLDIAFRDSDTGFGDLTVTPMLGWDEGKNHYALAVSVFVPTGFYEKAAVDIPNRKIQVLSFGKNRVAIDPTFSFTHMNRKSGIEVSSALGVTFSFKNDATDYQTAPEMHLELAALQHTRKGFAFGAQGYWYQQLGNDSGSGAESFQRTIGAKTLEARVFGFGPILTYQTKVGRHPLSTKLKYVHEFGARRRLESDVIAFNLAFGF